MIGDDIMTLLKLLDSIECKTYNLQNAEITCVTPDPEKCKNGSLFVCIKGLHRDGHDVIEKALHNGSNAFVIENSRLDVTAVLDEKELPYAVVDNSRSALSRLLSRLYNDPSSKLRITAVTGTNGKTSTVAMLNAIYSYAGISCATIGTLTSNMTTPDPTELYPLLKDFSDDGVSSVFMEASSHALSLNKLDPIIFENAIFTNLSPEHLDHHGNMEDYAMAKSRLFAQSKRSFINADDKYCDFMINDHSDNYFCTAKGGKSDFSAKDIRMNGANGSSYILYTENSAFKIELSIPGEFSIMNSLQAAACAYADGIPVRTIRYALKGFRGVKGRLERIQLPTNEFSVYIDFAHTPEALKSLLKAVRSFIKRDQRLILLFGCGGDRDKSKRATMGKIASELSDFVVITSDNSRSERTEDIISMILSEFDTECPHVVIEDRKEAIEFCISNAIHGDVIILAGKGHEEYQILNDGKHAFSEKHIVIDAVKRNLNGRGIL